MSQLLKNKHPYRREPLLDDIPQFSSIPTIQNLEISEDTMEPVAARLHGSAGPNSIDAVACSNWLLRFGPESKNLRQVIDHFTGWISSSIPPWAAIPTLLSNRLSAGNTVRGGIR